MTDPWKRRYTYQRQGVMLLLAGLLAVLWSSVVWNHYHSERQDIQNSYQQTEALALLFAKHTTATFRGIDHALVDLRETWHKRPTEMDQEIAHYHDFLNGIILQAAVVDAQGQLVYSSLGMPSQPSFLGDREHFKSHQADPADAMHVSRPVKGRVSNKWSIQLTRPLLRDGNFAGIIVLSVDPDYFVNFYKNTGLGADGVATMVRDTGEIMVRSSGLDKYVGKVTEPSVYVSPGAPLQGNLRRVSPNDGIERFFSYVRLPEYGLSVIIGPGVAERLADVHTQQRYILAIASIVTLITLLMGLGLLGSMAHSRAAQEALIESRAGLRASHELLENLSQHVPGMIFQYRLFADGHSSFPYVSNGIQALYPGLGPAQFQDGARQLFANVHPDDEPAMRASIAESARTLQPWRHEYRVQLPQRGLRWLAGLAQPERLDDGSVVWHGFVSDISANKAIEAALRTANEELETFSYSVSHDLRAPLGAISGFAALLAKRLAAGTDAKAQHHVARIRSSATEMEHLITDLLALARVGRAPMKHEPIDLSGLARKVVQGLKKNDPARRVALHIAEGLQAQGDAGLLRVVLENLLGNAWKYSARQSEATIELGQQPDGTGGRVFFVRDNGAGFDMAYADKLFQPFERLHTEAQFSGTGVGLATVSRIVLRHGGRIWADAAPGRGATFFFTLPCPPGAGRTLAVFAEETAASPVQA